MLAQEVISLYFDKVIQGLKDDAANTGQKIPDAFRKEVDASGGRLYAPDYFKYLIYGRGPGKQPPPQSMLEWVQKNPDVLASAKARYKYITEKGLAFIIGRKIGREGTDIYQGKKKGVDLLGVMENNMPDLLKQLAASEVINIATSLRNAVKK